MPSSMGSTTKLPCAGKPCCCWGGCIAPFCMYTVFWLTCTVACAMGPACSSGAVTSALPPRRFDCAPWPFPEGTTEVAACGCAGALASAASGGGFCFLASLISASRSRMRDSSALVRFSVSLSRWSLRPSSALVSLSSFSVRTTSAASLSSLLSASLSTLSRAASDSLATLRAASASARASSAATRASSDLRRASSVAARASSVSLTALLS